MIIKYTTLKTLSSNNATALIAALTLESDKHKTIVSINNESIDFNKLPHKFNIIHITECKTGYTGYLNSYKRS
jgi:hypothetical protein